MPNIFAVLWDLGGVVVGFDQSKTNRRLSAYSGRNLKEISAVLFGEPTVENEYKTSLVELFNTGQIDSHEFYYSLRKALQLNMSYKEFVDAWTDVFIIHEPVLNCIQRLHSKEIPQAILSSTNPLHLEKIVTLTRLDDLIGRNNFVTTYSVGVEKPNKKLFDAASTCLDIPLSHCVYIDDIQGYIDAGLGYGLGAGIHMNSNLPNHQKRCIASLNSLLFDKDDPS